MDAPRSDYQAKVRFGLLLNNEDSINTANDAVGFGVVEAGGLGAGAGHAKWQPRFAMRGAEHFVQRLLIISTREISICRMMCLKLGSAGLSAHLPCLKI
jgi:hypothetical protein